QDISFAGMRDHQLAVNAVLDKQPYIENYTSSIGAGPSATAPNNGRVFLRLKPRSTRPHVDQIIQDLRGKLAGIPGVNVYMQNPPLIRIGGQITKGLYQLTLQGPDLKELYHWGPVIQSEMAKLPGFQDVSTDLQVNNPQLTVEIDRDKSRALGVTAEQIENALYSAYGSRQVSTIYAPVNQYWVIMEVLPEYQLDPSALSQLYVRSSETNKLVPLQAVAKILRGV